MNNKLIVVLLGVIATAVSAMAIHMLTKEPEPIAAMRVIQKGYCKQQESAAKLALKSTYVYEEGFNAEFGKYTDSLTDIGWQDRPGLPTPSLEIRGKGFVATVRGPEGQRWQINQDNDLRLIEGAPCPG
jgi:hypothetical protein